MKNYSWKSKFPSEGTRVEKRGGEKLEKADVGDENAHATLGYYLMWHHKSVSRSVRVWNALFAPREKIHTKQASYSYANTTKQKG